MVTLADPAQAPSLGRALCEGNLPCVEVTYRTQAASASIHALHQLGDCLVGAGSVTTPAAVEAAAESGASFIVTPGLSQAVLDESQALGLPVIPGVATPTEIIAALDAGVSTVKVFPSGTLGGIKYLSAILAPFPGLRVMPTGGISPENLHEYFQLEATFAVGGTWLAPPAEVAAGDWPSVTARAQDAVRRVQLAREARGNLAKS